MTDPMDSAHRRDSVNERSFRDLARQIDALLTEPRFQGRISATTLTNLREAKAALMREADAISRVWD